MRNTSLIILAAAVLLGLLAVAGVRGVMSAGSSARTSEVSMTTVVVARKPLEFGNELSADALQEREWPTDATPEGSFAKIDEVVGAERRVALRSIAVGEPVLKDKVSGFGGRAALSQVIAEGYRAVAVRITDVSGAGGFILPGDRVDVLLTLSTSGDRLDTVANILLQSIRVLAIDQEADESTGGAIVAKAATIEVLPEDAQRIALASTIGTLSLSLRNTAGEEVDQAKANKTIRVKDLGPVQTEEQKAVIRATAPPYATMNVVRGVEPSRANVLRESAAARASIGGGTAQFRKDAAAGAGSVSAAIKLTAPAGE